MPIQKCPLCGNDAEFRGIDFGRKKKFGCTHCGTFVISPITEETIIKIKKDQRMKISEASRKCEMGRVLLIFRDEASNSIKWQCESAQKWS